MAEAVEAAADVASAAEAVEEGGSSFFRADHAATEFFDSVSRNLFGGGFLRATEEGNGFDALTKLEKMFAALGFNDPPMRFVAMFVVTTAVVFAFRPSGIFNKKDGKLSGRSMIQWWMPGVIVGAAAALFI